MMNVTGTFHKMKIGLAEPDFRNCLLYPKADRLARVFLFLHYIFFRILVKTLLTTSRTEVISATLIFRCSLGGFRRYFHSAYGISICCMHFIFSFHTVINDPQSKLLRHFVLSDERPKNNKKDGKSGRFAGGKFVLYYSE
jgi:hypothetical protein